MHAAVVPVSRHGVFAAQPRFFYRDFKGRDQLILRAYQRLVETIDGADVTDNRRRGFLQEFATKRALICSHL
jgi:hypothetical protein